MSSKRKMTEEEDERSKDNFWKKLTRYKPAKRKQKFKIHYTEFLTAANRDRRKKTSATLELNEDTSEEEIRNSLISELSQLKDQNFRFFTKDKEGTLYYCPCKPKCNEDHFKAEWNASNIAKVVKEDRPVHIFIEGVCELDESSSGYGTTVSQDNHRSLDPLEVEVRNAGSLVDYLTNEEPPPPLEIKEIVPEEGKVEGGYTFHLELKEYCTDVFKVQFGETDPIDVDRFDKVIYKGKVPASSNAGVVEVKIVQTSANVKNTIPFTYTDKDLEKKPDIDEQLKSMDEAQLEDLLIATAKQFSRINLKSNEEKTRHSDSGGGKNHSLPLLRMIADTAARINSIAFFEILFRTHAGCTLFKSFKDSQPPLEEIARLNGHLELAWMLEKKHLMFRDDESDSDDEVDWEAISKTIGKYQAKYDESVEKLSLQSIDSSRSVHGYLADRENSSSLSSLHVSIGETYNKESKMGGDHKFLEEKMKLIVRPYSEPVLSSIYDKVGRKWTTFSYDEVGSLRKKLTSCSTKHIDDNEAFCSLLSVDDLDAHLKRMKITAERKSSLKKSERKELQKLPDHHNFYNSRCHLDAFCSLKNSHIADTPSCHEEEDPLEKEEMLSCVRVNGLSTGSSSTDSSSPLNNRRRKPYFVWRCCQVTLILSVVTIMAFVTLFAVQAFYKTSVTLKSTGPCNATQNWVKYEDGSLSCIECPLCPPGLGLSAECGSSTPLSASISMKCIPCPLGVSFSSDYDSSICTPCSSCADSEKVQRNCSRTRDTKCAINCSEKDSSHNKCSTSTAVTPNSATTGNSFRKDPTSKTALLLPLIVLVSLTALLTMLWLLLSMIFCWSKLQEVAIRKRAVVIARARRSDRPDFGSSDLDAHLKRVKGTAERKSSLKINDRKELQKLPDFYNSRCHLDAFCSLKNSHIADTPLCCKEEDPLEKDELSCVRVNSSSTGSSPSDSSSPLNNRRRKPHFFWGYYKETFILSVIIFMATATVFALEAFYKTSVTLKSTGPCNATQNLVKYEDGSLSCKECPLCPPGLGLSAECGSSTPLSASISMKCIPCPLGVSFSSDYDSSICTPCSSCADSEKVQRNCSRTRDTKCAINCSEKDSHNKCITSTAVTPSSATTGNSLREDLTSKTALQLPLIGLASLTALLTMVVLLQFMILCWGKLQEVAIRKRAVVIARAKGRDRPDFGSSGGAKDKKERTQIFVDRESRRPLSEETM